MIPKADDEVFSLLRCEQCEVDDIWNNEVPDLEASAAQDDVMAEELNRIHISGIDPDFGESQFDPDVAFYDCLQKCCLTGTHSFSILIPVHQLCH